MEQHKESYLMSHHPQPKYAIRPIVPEAVYTNRQEHLNYLYQTALNAIDRRSMSVVLLGPVSYTHLTLPTKA